MKSSRPFSSRPGQASFAKGKSSEKSQSKDRKRPTVTTPRRGSGAPDKREDRGGARPIGQREKREERSEKPSSIRSGTGRPSTNKTGRPSFRKPSETTNPKGKESSNRFERSPAPIRAKISKPAAEAPAKETKVTEKRVTEKKERPASTIRSTPSKGRERAMPKMFFIWGRRPVDSFLGKLSEGKFGEALESTSTEKILSSSILFLMGDNDGKVPSQLKDSVDLATTLGIKMRVCKGHDDEMWPLPPDEGLQHQRVVLSVPSYPTDSMYDILLPNPKTTKGCVGIVLDQVQDPRNFGAILRSAAFFGCTFAVFGDDRQAPLSSTVLKASAGGAFSLQLSPVVNIGRALNYFKEKGIWIIGSSLAETSIDHTSVPLDRPYVLVLGNEGKGLRQEIANKCDYLVKIPGGSASLDSLNVGVACGILLERLRQSKD